MQPRPEEVFDDEVVFRLFQHLAAERHSSIDKAREIYEKTYDASTGEPSLTDLIDQKLITEVLGNLYVSRDLRIKISRDTTDAMPSFKSLLKTWYDEKYSWLGSRSDKAVWALAKRVINGKKRPSEIACVTREWVAARLWDRVFMQAATSVDRLKAWMDAWGLLGYPDFVPTKVWFQAASDAFQHDALEVLESHVKLPSWDDYRNFAIRQRTYVSGHTIEHQSQLVPPVPQSLVDRVLWMTSAVMEHARFDASELFGFALSPVSILLNEVEEADASAAPHPIAARVVSLAVKRPYLLSWLLFRVERHPRLVVELLLMPETAALACLLVFKWHSHSGAWDRELVTRANDAAKGEAFADAVSILGIYMKDGRTAPTEAAALLNEIHAKAKPGNIDELASSESMLATLRSELAIQPKAVLLEMFNTLVSNPATLRLGDSKFAAALDILDIGQLGNDASPDSLIDAYIEAIESDFFSLSAARVSTKGAAVLYELSRRLTSARRAKFLFPFEIRKRLSNLSESDNIYTIRSNIACALRVHIHVLGRAIAWFGDEAPDELVNALLETVQASAVSDDGAGRVAAFSGAFEVKPFRYVTDKPITADLGAALRVLRSVDADRLITAMLEATEPEFLADLLTAVPPTFRERVQASLEKLEPKNIVDSFPALAWHRRVDRLLAAGAVQAAKAFMVSEEKLPEQALAATRLIRLRHKLLLALLTEDWTTISDAELPTDIVKSEEGAARDTILFYQGVAQIKKPDGNVENAAKLFGILHDRSPAVPEYGFNFFAAQVASILKDGLFTRLKSEALTHARAVLVSADEMESRYDLSVSEADAYITNKALLLLAVGRTDDADHLLRPLNFTRMTDRTVAYSAIALSRLGRNEEAISALKQAEAVLGRSEILSEALKFIDGGAAPSMGVAINETNDPTSRIQKALGAFAHMDPIEQAGVWRGRDEEPVAAFDALVLNEVRSACAAVASLVSTMKVVEIDSSEEDINSIIRSFLDARLAYMNWSVSDESKGGHTGKGNPGRRDLLIHKGGVEFVVGEAVICHHSPSSETSRKDLSSHLQKLFSYAPVRNFFHLTYAYKWKYSDIVNELKLVAEHEKPSHVEFLGSTPLDVTDARPGGFVAKYKSDQTEIAVVFLVLDLGQQDMKAAGVLAAETKKPGPPLVPAADKKSEKAAAAKKTAAKSTVRKTAVKRALAK